MGGQTLGRGDLEPPKRLNLKSGALHKSFGLLTDFCQKCPYWDFRQLWGAPIFGPELPIRPKTSHPDLATVLGGVSPSPSCTDPAPPALYRTLGFSAMNPFDFQVIRCIFFLQQSRVICSEMEGKAGGRTFRNSSMGTSLLSIPHPRAPGRSP